MEAAHKRTWENLGCLCLTDEEPVQRALVDYFATLGMPADIRLLNVKV